MSKYHFELERATVQHQLIVAEAAANYERGLFSTAMSALLQLAIELSPPEQNLLELEADATVLILQDFCNQWLEMFPPERLR